MLGINVATDSWESKDGGIPHFFERARQEKRVILTNSKTLRERSMCPQSFFIPPCTPEHALVLLYQHYRLSLDSSRFLTVCGKCGGEIALAQLDDPHLVGKILPMDRSVYCCMSARCRQVYWWSDQPTSSPAKALKKAEELAGMIARELGIERQETAAGAAPHQQMVTVTTEQELDETVEAIEETEAGTGSTADLLVVGRRVVVVTSRPDIAASSLLQMREESSAAAADASGDAAVSAITVTSLLQQEKSDTVDQHEIMEEMIWPNSSSVVTAPGAVGAVTAVVSSSDDEDD
jgi:uncharacterized protein with PIN domain